MLFRRHNQSHKAHALHVALVVASAAALGALAPSARADSGSGSSGSGSGSDIRAFVPRNLLANAIANPDTKFPVIVQGTRGEGSDDVASDVDVEASTTADTSDGSKRRFRTLSAVSAVLTGKELVKLAQRDDIAAITRDARVKMTALIAPTLSGGNTAGSVLTADPAGWPDAGSYVYSYQWQRCDASGANCADIAGATRNTYRTGSVDIASTLRAVLTATGPDAASTAAPTQPSGVVAPISTSGFWSHSQWPYAVGLPELWAAAGSNAPAIAVVDSGIDPSVGGLMNDSTCGPQTITTSPANAPGDGRGHGTLVADLAAGRDHGWTGAAPRSNLISLDVLDDGGAATVSDVIAAADWIYLHKDACGIRVANFSLVGSVTSSFQFDPLDKAVEKLWLSGVVVVAAAGNYAVGGARSDVSFAPGNDPFVITVGATDIGGTIATADDVIAPWSAWGYTPDGFAKPELSAPGRYMIGAIPKGSVLATTRTDRLVGDGMIELSGTSFAAPVVAGVAADLLALHPGWSPDQVKGALMLSASPLPAATPRAGGVGEVNAAAAAAVANPPNPNHALNQFVDTTSNSFDATAWRTAVQSGASTWSAEMWGSAAWSAEMWGSAAWSAEMWGSGYWSAEMWGSEMWGSSMSAAEMWGSSTALGSEMWGSEMWGSSSGLTGGTYLMQPSDWDTVAPVPPPPPDPTPPPAPDATATPTDPALPPAPASTDPTTTTVTTVTTAGSTAPAPDATTTSAPPPADATAPPPATAPTADATALPSAGPLPTAPPPDPLPPPPPPTDPVAPSSPPPTDPVPAAPVPTDPPPPPPPTDPALATTDPALLPTDATTTATTTTTTTA